MTVQLASFKKLIPALFIAVPLLGVAAFSSAQGGFLGIANAGYGGSGYGGQHGPYKQSFMADINAPQEVPPTTSQATGEALFNVSMGEREIDYTVNLHNEGNITDLNLYCARPGANGPKVVSLFHSAAPVATQSYSGTIAQADVLVAAQACNPNIHTMSHLIQAMREGSIYINVLTSGFATGEIRGQLHGTATTSTGPGASGDTPTIMPSMSIAFTGQHIDFVGHNFPHETEINISRGGAIVAHSHADGGGNFSTGGLIMPTTPGTYIYTFTPVSGGTPVSATITVQNFI